MNNIETFCNINVIPHDIPEFLEYAKTNSISIIQDIPIDYSMYWIYRLSTEEINRTKWMKEYIISFKSKKAFMRFKARENVKTARKNCILYKGLQKHYENNYPIVWWNRRKEPIRLADCI